MSDGLFQDLTEYIRLSKDGLDLVRAADAALAQKLSYQLCQCTFPPQIMLWHVSTKETVCPQCQRKIRSFNRPLDYDRGNEFF